MKIPGAFHLYLFFIGSVCVIQCSFVPFAVPRKTHSSDHGHRFEYSLHPDYPIEEHMELIRNPAMENIRSPASKDFPLGSRYYSSHETDTQEDHSSFPNERHCTECVSSQWFGLDYTDASRSPPRASGSPGRNHYGHMDRENLVWYDVKDPHEEVFRLTAADIQSIFDNAIPGTPCASTSVFDGAAPRIFYDHFDDKWVMFYTAGSYDPPGQVVHNQLCFAISGLGDTVSSVQPNEWVVAEVDVGLKFNSTLDLGSYSDLSLLGLYIEADALALSFDLYGTDNATSTDPVWTYFQSYVMAVKLSTLEEATPLFTDLYPLVITPASLNQWAPADVDGARPVSNQAITFLRMNYWDPQTLNINNEVSVIEVWELSGTWNPANFSGGLRNTLVIDPVPSVETPMVVEVPDSESSSSGIVLWHTGIFGHRVVYRANLSASGGGDTGEHILAAFHRSADGRLAIEWIELSRLDPTEDWGLRRQGTLSAKGADIFNPSIASNQQGTKVVGYSISSSDREPSIAYQKVPSGEQYILHDGQGHPPNLADNWMVFSSMDVEPDNDTRFYYLNMQFEVTQQNSWQYVITSFKARGDDDDSNGDARWAILAVFAALFVLVAGLYFVSACVIIGAFVLFVGLSLRTKGHKDPFSYDEHWDETDSSGGPGSDMHEL